MSVETIYKLLTQGEWRAAVEEGVYRGSVHDRRDGFIHFSTAAQLEATARKYFCGVPDLVLLAVNVKDLTAHGNECKLRWEPARGGELFPHLHGEMPLFAVLSVMPVPLDEEGTPLLPQCLP